jgi:hypothetical protein
MGAVRLPLWLNEGLAMWCGGLLAPDDFAQNDVRIAQVLAQERELSAPELVTHDEFYAEDQASTAYVQGFAMTRYLESEIGMQGILQLLTLAREKGDFDEAFSEGLGVDYYTFYRMWLDASVGMVETGGFNTR